MAAPLLDTRAYRPHRPQDTLLYSYISSNLETWLAGKRDACPFDDPVPSHIDRYLHDYLRCGIPAHGFARVRCPTCKNEYVLAFSCKTRHLCPSCAARRMAATAAHLIDNVIPHVPTRQWVLSLPRRIRPFLISNEKTARAIHGIFLRAINTQLRSHSPDAPRASLYGAVGWYHRFGAYINRHPHFHDIVTDGVFSFSPDLTFHEAVITPEDIMFVQHKVRTRTLRWLANHNHIDHSTRSDMLSWDHGGGFSVDASVSIPAWNRQGLERLIRYCARPSFSLERLFRIDDSHIGYTPKKPTMDGRSHIVFSNIQLLDAITALIPPPHRNSHSYFGVFAPHFKHRTKVVEKAGPSTSLELRLQQAAVKQHIDASRSRTWAMLMARIFELLPLVCERCGSEMEIVSFITDPPEIRKILEHIGLDPDPPPIAPARGPPQASLHLDQTANEEFEDFDQTLDAPDYES
jgi:hypothetical protein